MHRGKLRLAREQRGWTEVKAASRLGVSQSYLAMLERGQRRVTPRLARRFKNVYNLSPATLPPRDAFVPRNELSGQEFARRLASLDYPGFSYLRPSGQQVHPGEVLLDGLAQEHLEARLAEALPWLLLKYWEMDMEWLVRQAKLNDLQNRLGFLVSLAKRASERSSTANQERDSALKELENTLSESRLAKEDTFMKKLKNDSERQWLRERRSEEARYWNLLTDWRAEHLSYAL
ncbi:MAG TPA: helix-turn-helix transcriptional regulator [Candidatus Acidoferrum sp.]|nr:helix-turn-helix transcriptional regulator [Candidatus Acidoferrum sp.]